MKYNRLALALIVTSFAATPAFAASVTMLQFGSFETRDEAEKKLADISGKYKDTLGALPTNIREVKLPPDNLTVYRTQAGPVADRSSAQSICAKLAATGDECYIVQTAMVNATAPAVATVTTPAPSITARDPMNNAALNSVSTPLVDTAETPVSNTEAAAFKDQSPEMQSALDKAASNQSMAANDIDSSTAAVQQEQHRSFWARMNPFSDTPKPAPVVPAAPPLVAAPVEVVSSEPLPPPVVAPATSTGTITQVTPASPMTPVASSTVVVPAASAAAIATPALAPLPAAQTQTPAPTPAPVTQSVGFNNSNVITEAPLMQLPPPPAPLNAQDRAMLASGKMPLPTPEPTSGPIMVNALPPTTAAQGNVQVEEARRVPVTTPVMTAPAPFVQAPVMMQPGSSDGMKTIWAQIGPFMSNDDALAYWANYRQNHPDFPVVRVRVTSSYQQLMHGVNSYSLRIGPIAQRAFVNSLCQSLPRQPQGQEPLHCASVSDLGSSAPLQPTQGYLPPSRYNGRR